jgi:hypothetical protein
MSIIEQKINIYIYISGGQDLLIVLSKLIIKSTSGSHRPPYQYWKYEL